MEYVYKLILVERLFEEKNWTEKDEKITSDHFKYLLNLQKENKIILAGKTEGLTSDTYGLVIFSAETDVEAENIMKNDPAVKNNIMYGFLQRYNVAIFNENYKMKRME